MAAKTDLLPSCVWLLTAYRKDWYLWCIDGVTGLALGGGGWLRKVRSVCRSGVYIRCGVFRGLGRGFAE